MKTSKILIAEDEMITSIDIKNILQNDGYEVVGTVTTGEEALQQVIDKRPDVVLLDITLQGKMDGIETARRIKAEYDIPIIYVTAHSDNATLERAKITEPGGYILKPLKKEDLRSTIETVLYKHELEVRLKESEAKYRQLFSVVSESIIIFELDSFRIIDANAAAVRMYGYGMDELLGLKLTDLSADDEGASDPVNKSDYKTLIDSPVRFHRKKNGDLFSVEISSGFFMLNEKSIGIVAIRDITKRKKLEDDAAMVKKFEAVGILAGGIAHDFNNLLTAISGNVALAKMSSNPSDEVYESILEIEKASVMAKDLSAQLLNFARLSKPVIGTLPIAEILKEAALLTSAESGIQYNFIIPDDLWQVQMDPGQIRRVLFHIVTNARDSMPDGGTITIRAENKVVGSNQMLPVGEGAYVQVSIADEGCGIPEENLSKIFDPYFTTKKNFNEKGMGLGLSLAYSIIRRHHGHIMAKSKAGAGSVFIFYLPAAR